MHQVIARVGRVAGEGLDRVGKIASFGGSIFRSLFTSLPPWRILLPTMYEIGVNSVPVVLATGLFVGMVLAVQMHAQLASMSAETAAGMIINVSMVKELGPVLAAVILAGRVGGAMAAELGTMRVTEQIDAISAMGADPIRHLVAPRFLATVLLIPLLTVLSAGIGVIGGWFVTTQAYGVSSHYYWGRSKMITTPWDLYVGLAKSFAFGAVIALIACYKGFTCGPGAEGVGRATTKAFVISFMSILVCNFFLAVLFRHIYYQFVV